MYVLEEERPPVLQIRGGMFGARWRLDIARLGVEILQPRLRRANEMENLYVSPEPETSR